MISAKIRQKIAELWCEDMTRGGKAIHLLLEQQPVKPPSIRFVQDEVSKLNQRATELEPRTELKLWQHKWYEDPEKVPVLLALHYMRAEVEGHNFAGMYVEEARWALKISKFFDVSSPVHVYLLFKFAANYANLELLSILSDSTLDTHELDTALLEFSGVMFEGNSHTTGHRLLKDFLTDLKRVRPEYLEDSNAEEPGIRFSEEHPKSDGHTNNLETQIDQWKQLEWELARAERERFIAEGRFQASENTNWERSADKTYFENQENDIRSRAAGLYETPEGKVAYELFARSISVKIRLQFP